MKRKIKPTDNSADQKNANKGTKGVNKQYSKTQGNRSRQLDSNNMKESLDCKPTKKVRKFIQEQQKIYHKPIKEIIPLIQSKKAKLGETIKKGSLISKTQSILDKCSTEQKNK